MGSSAGELVQASQERAQRAQGRKPKGSRRYEGPRGAQSAEAPAGVADRETPPAGQVDQRGPGHRRQGRRAWFFLSRPAV